MKTAPPNASCSPSCSPSWHPKAQIEGSLIRPHLKQCSLPNGLFAFYLLLVPINVIACFDIRIKFFPG